ncbi:MAG: class I SAM-dependent methyltransferase [Rhodocyclaceae bacterium]|nr:class I SAM-dependent methyltransferase [Rhodocyclaceae bacterium]
MDYAVNARMKKLKARCVSTFLDAFGSLLGWLVHKARVDDAVMAGVLARVFSRSRRNAASITSLLTASSSSAVLIENLDARRIEGNVSAIINFSSTWRDEWVIRNAAQISPGASVLDAGAGECQYKKHFAHTKYKTQDFVAYKGTTEGVQVEQWNYGRIDYVCDITAIPVPDASFDVVLCTEVLEHVQDPIATLRELTRVLRPGGKLLLSAPLGCGLHQQPHHYYGGFTPFFYREYLSRFGMTVTEIKPLGGLLRHVAQECHRVGRVISAGDVDGSDKAILDVLMNWMPRVLSALDDKYFVEEFAVGYLVEATKAAAIAESTSSP